MLSKGCVEFQSARRFPVQDGVPRANLMPDARSTDWFGCGFLPTGHVFPIALAKNLFVLLPSRAS